MDVVYPIGTGSLCKNQELKYSLRSLKYISYDKVFTIGHKVGFIIGTYHHHLADHSKKQINVIRKLLYACDISNLSDDFIFMNDDFFFLQETTIKNYINRLSLDRLQQKTPNSNYGKALNNTIEWLKKNNLPLLNFEIHYPMIFNKQKFKKLFEPINLDREYNYRSMYGNYYGLQGIPVKDFKIHEITDFNEQKQREFLSISDRLIIYDRFKNYIKSKFPDKSKFELTSL